MDESDQEWLNNNMDDSIHIQGKFKGIGFYSTDGKLTFSFEADTPEGLEAGDQWARRKYEQAKFTYGTKQSISVKEYAKAEGKEVTEDLGKCPKCGAPNARSMKGKVYCSAKCWLK